MVLWFPRILSGQFAGSSSRSASISSLFSTFNAMSSSSKESGWFSFGNVGRFHSCGSCEREDDAPCGSRDKDGNLLMPSALRGQ